MNAQAIKPVLYRLRDEHPTVPDEVWPVIESAAIEIIREVQGALPDDDPLFSLLPLVVAGEGARILADGHSRFRKQTKGGAL